MKKPLTIASLICLIFFASCSRNKKNETNQQLTQNQTPETFDERSDISSFSTKRYESDIIQKLYKEAMDKNQALKSLNNKIGDIAKFKNDSLQAYNKYIQQNDNYFVLVGEYINALKDSTLKNAAKEIFAKLENDYTSRIAKHKIAVENIDTKTQTLNDQVILMKLLVTAPMMKNYQKNELPDIKSIHFVSLKYDSLINDTKPYTKMK